MKTSCGCWLHLLGIRGDGYATIKRGGVQRGAHQVAWAQHNGPIPKGLWVLHRCDVRCCVNPSHLFLGTAKDNAADRQAKGRSARPSNAFLQSRKGKPLTDYQRQCIIDANKRRSQRIES